MEHLSLSTPVFSIVNSLSMDRQKKDQGHFATRGCHLENTKSNDVIIVGAGVAGSALAYTLGKDGRRVHVIERNLAEPNRIVGELLQPGGYLKLVELGLDDCVKDIDAQMVFGYALYKGGKDIRLNYPLEDYHFDVAGRSFHHGRFVQRMRRKAESLPNVKLEQGMVTSLLEERGTIKGVEYKTRTGEELKAYAPLTIVCDGCFSSLRSSLSKPKVTKPSHFAGLVLENCQLPHPRYAHVILGNPSSIIFYPISSKEVRFLIDLPGSKVPSISDGKMSHFLKTQVAPQIPPELHSAFVSSVDKGQIRIMPISCMPAAPNSIPGALLLGDALNMRHPLTGGGMTVALYDIVVLRDLLRHIKNLDDTSAVSQYLELFYKIRKPVAFTMNLVAGALSKVSYTSQDEAREELQQASFDYISLSDILCKGPVALISGLNPNPCTLLLYFFAVAIYGVGRLLLPFPTPKRAFAAARLILGALAIIIPIIKEEGVEHVFFATKVPATTKVSLYQRRNRGDKEP